MIDLETSLYSYRKVRPVGGYRCTSASSMLKGLPIAVFRDLLVLQDYFEIKKDKVANRDKLISISYIERWLCVSA